MEHGALLLRPPLRDDVRRFIADAHLGGLAQILRLAGFDMRYDNNFADDEIERLADEEACIVLTRDRELLAPHVRAFRLCLMCNAPRRPANLAELDGRVPDGVRERHTRFVTCDVCRRAFWEGSHWKRMRARIDALADAGRA